jgi:three-Cys-motif partner protein
MAELDSDGLPLGEVGEWALDKHERLKKYVDITSKARLKYIQGTGGATYIDLFSGPGRARIRDTSTIIDGSPLVAFQSAKVSKVPFSEIHLADAEAGFSAAASNRIKRAGGRSNFYVGQAADTAREIVAKLNPYGLHFAFLDPYNLAGLSFDIIRTLASLKRIDMLLHVSIQDMQRNSGRYMSEEYSAFDAFAPGWRTKVDLNQNLNAIRAAMLEHWQTLIRELGFQELRSVELVRGSRSQRLYWLAFVSRHQIANDFWDKIRNISGQKELDI